MSVKITYFVHATSVDNEQGICSGWNESILSEQPGRKYILK